MLVDLKITTILMYGNVVLFKCYKQKLNELIERLLQAVIDRRSIYHISPSHTNFSDRRFIALSLANENCPLRVCVTERGNIWVYLLGVRMHIPVCMLVWVYMSLISHHNLCLTISLCLLATLTLSLYSLFHS